MSNDEDIGGFTTSVAEVFCPSGKKVLGGGVWTNHSNVVATTPFANGWHGVVSNPFVSGETWTVYAICANAS